MDAPFEYVYVNQDGTVREVSPEERVSLLQKYAPGDGARPYIKFSYNSLNGWKSMSGFMHRSKVLAGQAVQPINPNYDALAPTGAKVLEGILADHAASGDTVIRNPDGSVTIKLNRGQKTSSGILGFFRRLFGGSNSHPTQKGFETMQRLHLQREAQRENLAKPPNGS